MNLSLNCFSFGRNFILLKSIIFTLNLFALVKRQQQKTIFVGSNDLGEQPRSWRTTTKNDLGPVYGPGGRVFFSLVGITRVLHASGGAV